MLTVYLLGWPQSSVHMGETFTGATVAMANRVPLQVVTRVLFLGPCGSTNLKMRSETAQGNIQ